MERDLQRVPSALQGMVKKLEGHGTLTDADRQAILDLPHVVKTLQRGEHIVRDGDRAEYSCLMLSGYSVREKIVAAGGRQILAIQMKGDIVDLQNSFLQIADHSVTMLTAGRVALIPRQAVRALSLERQNIGQAMWLETLVEGSVFREWIANVGRRDATTRIAHLLCEFGLRVTIAGLGSEQDYELPMTQDQLGDATGLTPVHVNRTLKSFDERRLIERVTPRAIVIGDWKNLAEVGDFDPKYLHLPASYHPLIFGESYKAH